jgi:phage-related protein
MSALTNLTNATGDTDEALKRLTLAQDLARGTGMSLEQASKLLGKTSDENTATLARYGIQLGENATAQDVMNEVDARFGGQAAAFAESDAGKWAQLQLQMTELQETIGGMLIPAFTFLATAMGTIMTAMEPVTSFIEANIKPIMIGLAAAITVIVIPAFIAWAAAAGAAALATIVAMAPIIAIAAAVGIAVAALYLAWSTNFLGIRDITMQVIDFVGPYISTALAAIQAVFDTVWPYIQTATDIAFQAISLYVTTYIGIVQSIIETVLPIIQGVFQTVWPIVQAAVETAMNGVVAAANLINDVYNTVSTVLGQIQSAFQTIWDACKLAVETAMSAIQTAAGKISGVYTTISTTLNNIKTVFTTTWDAIVSLVREKVEAVITAVTSAARRLYDAGASLVQNLIDGITSKIGALTEKIGELADKLKIEVPGFSPVDEAGYEQGRMFADEFAKGISDGTSRFVAPALGGVGSTVAGGGGGGSNSSAGRNGSAGRSLEDRLERAIERGMRRALSGAT